MSAYREGEKLVKKRKGKKTNVTQKKSQKLMKEKKKAF